MIPISVQPAEVTAASTELVGAVVTQQARLRGKRRFRKGQRISEADLGDIAALERPLHVVQLEADDLHEDEAGVRIASLVSGPNLRPRKPVQSRVNIEATVKGLVRVDAGAVFTINQAEGVGLFTVPDHLPVVPGKIVAGAKIAPVSIPAAVLDGIAGLLRRSGRPVLEVRPFLPHRVGVVITEGLAENLRARFETAVTRKMAWYGSTIEKFEYVGEDGGQVVPAIRAMMSAGIDLLLTAGGNMMDPLDPALLAIPEVGGHIVRLGAPAHPGSMFWLGHIDAVDLPVVNLASCSMYSKATVADLVLPRVLAGERVTPDDMARMGYGGLLDRDMGWRFPDYEADTVDEPDD